MRVTQVSTQICTPTPVGLSRLLLMPVFQSLVVLSPPVFKPPPCLTPQSQLVPLKPLKLLATLPQFSTAFPIWALQATILCVRPLKKHQRVISQRLLVVPSLLSTSTHGKFASWLVVASAVVLFSPTDGFSLLPIVVMVLAPPLFMFPTGE